MRRLETIYWNLHGNGDWMALISNTGNRKFNVEIWWILQTQNLVHWHVCYIKDPPLQLFTSTCKCYGFGQG
jgi:hypothetical protein